MAGPENDLGDEDVVADADAGGTELIGDPAEAEASAVAIQAPPVAETEAATSEPTTSSN